MALKAAPEPLRPTTMPNKPWQDLHIDLYGPFQTGESLLVFKDAWTRSSEVIILKTTTSAAIISHLKKIFAAQGMPVTVFSDNGPQFVSEEFEAFLRNYGIDHHTGHRPKRKWSNLTEHLRKPCVVTMSRGRTGAKNCSFSS